MDALGANFGLKWGASFSNDHKSVRFFPSSENWARSSVGQSRGLIILWSQVRVLPGPPVLGSWSVRGYRFNRPSVDKQTLCLLSLVLRCFLSFPVGKIYRVVRGRV